MGTDKRDRQKSARRARLEAEAVAARRRQSVRRIVTLGVVAIVGGALLWSLNSRGGDDGDASLADQATTTTGPDEATGTTLPVPDTVPAAALRDPETGEFAYGEGECAPEEGADERRIAFDQAPAKCIDPAANDYRAVVETSMGTFHIDLYDDRAPGTVNSFVNLARWNYYDGIVFHRVVDDFVTQAGDPTATGRAGPGYEIADELPDSAAEYRTGSVAMANAGPDTNGSQFFVYHGPNPLPGPDFSLFGRVTGATLDVTAAILEVDTGPGDRPVSDVVIENLTVERVDDGTIDDTA